MLLQNHLLDLTLSVNIHAGANNPIAASLNGTSGRLVGGSARSPDPANGPVTATFADGQISGRPRTQRVPRQSFNPDLFSKRLPVIFPGMRTSLQVDCRPPGSRRMRIHRTWPLLALCAWVVLPMAKAQDFVWTTNADRTLTLAQYVGSEGEVTLPDRIGGLPVARIGDNAFDYCKSLTRVAIPDSVTGLGKRAFSYCSGLTQVELGQGVASIGEQAFFYCWSLARIDLPDRVASIGERAFYSCSGLTNLAWGRGLATLGDEAFAYCSGLTQVKIPDGATTIGKGAFASCTNLLDVTIPASVTRIGDEAFRQCGRLRAVYFLGEAPSLGIRVFDQADQVGIYHRPGIPGWRETLGDRPAAPWTPEIPAVGDTPAPPNPPGP